MIWLASVILINNSNNNKNEECWWKWSKLWQTLSSNVTSSSSVFTLWTFWFFIVKAVSSLCRPVWKLAALWSSFATLTALKAWAVFVKLVWDSSASVWPVQANVWLCAAGLQPAACSPAPLCWCWCERGCRTDWGCVRDQECVQLISLLKHMNEGSRRQMAAATTPHSTHTHTHTHTQCT